jgi:hypothetical protein
MVCEGSGGTVCPHIFVGVCIGTPDVSAHLHHTIIPFAPPLCSDLEGLTFEGTIIVPVVIGDVPVPIQITGSIGGLPEKTVLDIGVGAGLGVSPGFNMCCWYDFTERGVPSRAEIRRHLKRCADQARAIFSSFAKDHLSDLQESIEDTIEEIRERHREEREEMERRGTCYSLGLGLD